jgi:membrane peptidoglycan carboxypeptidase
LPESVNTYFVGMEDQLFGCDLTPVVNMALSLGMTGLNDPESAGSTTTIAQAVISQHQTGFTLGFAPTSPLQLSAAYGAVANDGVLCQSTPVASVTAANGAPVSFKTGGCSQVLDVQIARTMAQMMTVDTTNSIGTAASYFRSWYSAGGSQIASKTGTDNDDANGNSSLWFVGITPTLVSAAALFNPAAPKATITGLPTMVRNDGSDVFGAYASTFWLAAYRPMLLSRKWSFPSPSSITGARTVPSVIGLSQASATTELVDAGYQVTTTSTRCGGSPEIVGAVAYYAPQIAPVGSTISLCLSSGLSRTSGAGRTVTPGSESPGSGGAPTGR